MPGRPAKVCTYPGCGALTHGKARRCEAHPSTPWRRAAEPVTPPTTTARGYGWAWQKLRLAVLKRDNYLCQIALGEGLVISATEVDHIVPKAEGGTDDMDNLQAVSHDRHRAKTKLEAARGAGGYVPISKASPP